MMRDIVEGLDILMGYYDTYPLGMVADEGLLYVDPTCKEIDRGTVTKLVSLGWYQRIMWESKVSKHLPKLYDPAALWFKRVDPN